MGENVNQEFKPHHLNASAKDLEGNNGIGRYILIPGSDGRAKEIAQHFKNLSIKEHPRGHHLYLGSLNFNNQNIDVACVSSGMGCASMEIILHELFHLGGKRFLRVGTAGSLQPDYVEIGDFINVQASVRDEKTSRDYAPLAVPAIASLAYIDAISQASIKLALNTKLHSGTVHCKSSLYAREFGAGPLGSENLDYDKILRKCGVLATEMETATLFIQCQSYNHQLSQLGNQPAHHVLCGAVLGIIAKPPESFINSAQEKVITSKLIELSLETINYLFTHEK